MRSINVNKKGKTMKKTLKEKAAIFRTKAAMLKEQNVRLQNGMSNVSEQNKSLELEVEKLKSALVVKDLQKDLDHSEEKHKLKDEIISLLKDRPKNVKVEVLPASAGNNILNGTSTGSSTTTTGTSYGTIVT